MNIFIRNKRNVFLKITNEKLETNYVQFIELSVSFQEFQSILLTINLKYL